MSFSVKVFCSEQKWHFSQYLVQSFVKPSMFSFWKINGVMFLANQQAAVIYLYNPTKISKPAQLQYYI